MRCPSKDMHGGVTSLNFVEQLFDDKTSQTPKISATKIMTLRATNSGPHSALSEC